MMKLAYIVALLLVGATVAQGHVLARELAKQRSLLFYHPNNNDKTRELYIDCSQAIPAAESILSDVYGVGFDCTCSGGTIACQSKGETCCGDTCMTIQETLVYSYYGDPVSETACVTFTGDSVLGEPLLAGATRCVTAEYCGYSVCSCNATLQSTPCDACHVCGDVPGDTSGLLEYMATDCSNVAGGDVFSFECEDFDTIEEIEEFAFTNCSGAVATFTGAWELLVTATIFASFYFGL